MVNSIVKDFFDDFSGICYHLHVEYQKSTEEKVSNLFNNINDNIDKIILNVRLFMGHEREFLQSIGMFFDWDCSSIRALSELYNEHINENPEFKVVFLLENAEELNEFRFGFLKEFLFFVSENNRSIKIVTLSCLPWSLISLNFEEQLSHGIQILRTERLTPVEIEVRCHEQLKANGSNAQMKKTIKYILQMMPKNLEPELKIIYVKKTVEEVLNMNCLNDFKEITQVFKNFYHNKPLLLKKPSSESVYEKLPYKACLTLIASYFASFNPPSTDKRYFGEQKVGKRKNNSRAVIRENFHETGPKAFTLERLEDLYSMIKTMLLAECGDLDVKVQVPLLLSRGHLEKISDLQNVIQPKFRCVAPLDYVDLIKRDFLANCTKKTDPRDDSFNLRDYLHDFAFETQ